ncbi:uncharacterized protein LOC127992799 [Carassius gibelio]|uniref:uncharacterized protein LOC127992799 n=1 Tax=Carassius gibelio TaxID=101364 RepID=UPI0022785F72|nr:uncharacterized protein LOC127992799 [Carassius gibelio]
MTRPKFRPCPSCQTPNQASRKTCHVCFGSLSTKNKIKEKVASLDSQWGKSVLKSRNAGRIIDSARIAVLKLEAVGYKPILFIGKQDKRASNKWVADIITHLHPTPVTKVFLEKMRRAYEFILTKATSTAQRPESVPAEQPESLTKQPETVFVLNLVPVSCSLSPTFLCPPSSATSTTVLPSLSSPLPPPLRQRKRRLNTFTASNSTTPVSPPYPSASSISKPLSQEVPLVKNRRKGCQKCSRQKVFLFDKITGERINEGKAELKVHWLPCTVCGKTWDDTWEPASEFQHIVPKSPHPNQLSA